MRYKKETYKKKGIGGTTTYKIKFFFSKAIKVNNLPNHIPHTSLTLFLTLRLCSFEMKD